MYWHFFVNRQFHRAWMKFADRFTRDIQCLVQIAIELFINVKENFASLYSLFYEKSIIYLERMINKF